MRELSTELRRRSSTLQEHKLRRLEGVSRRSRALWGPLNGLIVDG